MRHLVAPGPRTWATGALLFLAASFTALATLHAHAVQRSDMPAYLSDFAHRPMDGLWVASLGLLACAAICIAMAMRDLLPREKETALGGAMLWTVAVGSIAVALFPTDPGQRNLAQGLHAAAAAPTLTAMLLAPAALTSVFARDVRMQSITLFTDQVVFLLSASLVGFAAAHVWDAEAVWFLERAVVGLGITWMAAIAWHVRGLADHEWLAPSSMKAAN